MKNKTICILLGFLALQVSCGSSENEAPPQGGDTTSTVTESISYCYGSYVNFNYLGCSTGHKKFDSTSALCAALPDEDANHSCAFEQRKKLYEQKCTGSWPGAKEKPAEPRISVKEEDRCN